ncbi:hypothetical protein Leryth_015006, partial [Lithospermum erythrorhizon]
VGSVTFQTRFQPHLVWTLEQIKKNIEDKTHQHLDARSQARYTLFSFICDVIVISSSSVNFLL